MPKTPVLATVPDCASNEPYFETSRLVQLAHRRLLDVIGDEFRRRGRDGITAVQALMLFSIGDDKIKAGEIRTRNCYLGSNVSYNLSKLCDAGLLKRVSSSEDRRVVHVKLTKKGLEVRDIVQEIYRKHAHMIERAADINPSELKGLNETLKKLEQFWLDRTMD